jgi:hypothetical protein
LARRATRTAANIAIMNRTEMAIEAALATIAVAEEIARVGVGR